MENKDVKRPSEKSQQRETTGTPKWIGHKSREIGKAGNVTKQHE